MTARLDFAIVGAQKAASTLLQVILASHPAIDMPAAETAVFEDFDDEAKISELIESCFKAGHSQLRGIKRPTYLYDEEVCRRLARFSPDTKIIVILRDPLSRAVSAYYHYIKDGFLPNRPINDGLSKIISGDVRVEWPRGSQVIEYGLYANALKCYLAAFGADRVLVLLQEEFL